MGRDVRIAVYGDVNLNIIDGSAIWLQSIASVLAAGPRNDVTVVLKAAEKRDILTRPIKALEGVTVVNPIELGWVEGEQLSRNRALEALERLDDDKRFDIFIMRGFDLCHAAAMRRGGRFSNRLWSYCTDVPQLPGDITDDLFDKMTTIAEHSRYVLCQTEAFRCYLESYVPASANKAILLPPMIPDITAGAPSASADDAPLKLVYIGKYAPLWNTLEMTQAVAELRDEGLNVELHMVGDKIHRPHDKPEFHDEMERALKETEGVVWHGGKAREEAQQMLADYDITVGWRDARLDESLELSTKLLEYGAASRPAIINRNPMHEMLFGADYPLFANSKAAFKRAVCAARDADVVKLATERCHSAAKSFTFSSVSQVLQPYIDRAVPLLDLRERRKPLKLLVACHDFKFFTRIQDHLGSIRGVELKVDAWKAINEHDESASERLLEWADVIICEWCTDGAIWYSKRKRANQRLIIRLHRFELYGRYCKQLDFDKVDKVVFVGDYYRDEAVSRLGWSESKLAVIPNWVDTQLLDRPKVFGALFNLGMIGIAPRRKRLDRGLTILAKLRERDSRFQLYIKTKMPWAYWWIWRDPDEQAHFRDVFRRINSDPRLVGAVHFDDFGPDVGAWLRKIGFVLSTSDDESFHLAPAEGMASRALPMLLDWEGVDAIYESEWISNSEDQVVDKIISIVEAQSWLSDGERAREQISTAYSVERVCHAWQNLVLG